MNFIVLLELFDSGYCVNDKDVEFGIDFKVIEYGKLKNELLSVLSIFVKFNKVYLVVCSIEKMDKKFYDSVYIILLKGGIVGKYCKIYLWGDEKLRFKRGKKYEVFMLDFGDFSMKVGL